MSELINLSNGSKINPNNTFENILNTGTPFDKSKIRYFFLFFFIFFKINFGKSVSPKNKPIILFT